MSRTAFRWGSTRLRSSPTPTVPASSAPPPAGPSTIQALPRRAGTAAPTIPTITTSSGGVPPTTTSNPCLNLATLYPKYYGARDLDGDGTTDVNGSFIKDESALARLYNMRNPTLAEGLIDQLRSIAIAQGNYWEKARPTNAAWKTPDEENAVMFFDLTKTDLGGTVDLGDIVGFSRATNMSGDECECSDKSLAIVIEGGNAKLNSNPTMFGSLILTSPAPYGQVTKANGTASFIGTIFADNINLVGNVDLSLDACFLANLSPALPDPEHRQLPGDRPLIA